MGETVTQPTTAEELRRLAAEIRRRPTPIKDIIPLLDRAATELEGFYWRKCELTDDEKNGGA